MIAMLKALYTWLRKEVNNRLKSKITFSHCSALNAFYTDLVYLLLQPRVQSKKYIFSLLSLTFYS